MGSCSESAFGGTQTCQPERRCLRGTWQSHRDGVEEIAFGSGQTSSCLQGIKEIAGGHGNQHGDGPTAIGHLDTFSAAYAPDRSGRILLELTHTNSFHVRQRSTCCGPRPGRGVCPFTPEARPASGMPGGSGASGEGACARYSLGISAALMG